jgi:hypothetical protein
MIFWKKDAALSALTSHTEVIVRVETATDYRDPGDGNGSRNHYEIFSDPGKLYARIAAAPENVSFHEITRVATDPYPSPQRMYFDIDADRDRWGALTGQEVEARAAAAICAAAEKWAVEMGFRGIFRAYVAGSSDFITKVSLHVVFPDLLFADIGPLKRAAMRIVGYLEPWLANCVDVLYKKNQGLRLLWARKAGTSRQKVPLGQGPWSSDPVRALTESTIHIYCGEPRHCIDDLAPPPKEWGYLGKENGSDLMAMLGALEEAERAGGGDSLPAGGAYRELSTHFLESGAARTALRRVAPSYCIVCHRLHESENPYVLQKGGIYRFYCRRSTQVNGRQQSTVFYIDESLRQAAIAARRVRSEAQFPPPYQAGRISQMDVGLDASEAAWRYGTGNEDDFEFLPATLTIAEDRRPTSVYDDEELAMRIDIGDA